MAIAYFRRLRSARARAAFCIAGLICFVAVGGWTLESPSKPANLTDTLRNHLRYLAAEERMGRAVGNIAIAQARDYIAAEFAAYGLTGGGDNGSFLQGFEVTAGVSVMQPAALVLNDATKLLVHEEWIPLGLSASGSVDAEVVFAGYGITAKEFAYDDYAGIDANGKIVLVLRYEPPPQGENSPFRNAPDYSNYATLRAKADNAADHGALGMIVVDLHPPRQAAPELLPVMNSFSRSVKVVAAQAKRRVIESWLEGRGISLSALKDKIDRDGKPASSALPGAKVSMSVTLAPLLQRAENVVGVLPGSDPSLKGEAVVIGAHYDHLGYGHYGARDHAAEGQIHPGADDNASGSALLLHLARRLSQLQPRPARSIVFVAFSGEELGLFGSSHYVNYPTVRLSATRAMINFDMVGRLRDNRVTVFGTRTAKELSDIVAQEARALGLEITESDRIGASDHMPFYNKKIPVLHFFTGSHPDYHRPTDTWEKLNLDGMVKVSELAFTTVVKIAGRKEPLLFTGLAGRPPAEDGDGSPFRRAYLGSIPDFDNHIQGVRLAGVAEGSPAARAGLQEGDIIIRFAEAGVGGLEDLAGLLAQKKPGDEVEIIVLRSGARRAFKATLGARS